MATTTATREASKASQSSSTTLTKRSEPSGSLIVAPPTQPPVKRIKRPAIVLEEESYEAGLEHIIRRDFFPGLVETEAKRDYLEALAADDKAWIAEAGRRLRALTAPGPQGKRARDLAASKLSGTTPISRMTASSRQTSTPRYTRATDTPKGWVGDTPMTTRDGETPRTSDNGGGINGKEGAGSTEPDMMNLSLSDFQRRYTSEDNESFYKLLDRANAARASKHAYLWSGSNKLPSSRQIAQSRRSQALLAARAAETATNGRELARVDLPDERPAMPDTWRARPDNGFMFAPDGVDDVLGSEQRRAEARSRMGDKAIVLENTRMPPPPRPGQRKSGHGAASADVVPPSPSMSAVRAAIAGRPRLSMSELGDGGSSMGDGSETPRVNGWAFVDSEEPEPEEDEGMHGFNDDDDDDLISEIDLGPGDARRNPFVIREQRSREALHHRLVDRINRNKTDKRLDSLRTPVSRSAGSPRVVREAMSPAARRLLGSMGRSSFGTGAATTKGGRSGHAGDGDSWAAALGTPRAKPTLAGVTPVRKR